LTATAQEKLLLKAKNIPQRYRGAQQKNTRTFRRRSSWRITSGHFMTARAQPIKIDVSAHADIQIFAHPAFLPFLSPH